MTHLKTFALISVLLVATIAPAAHAGVKDKDFVKLPAAEQADVTRTEYYKRVRLMGADEDLAKKLSYSSYFENFLVNRQAWAHLKMRYKKTKKVPGKKLTRALIGGGAGDRVNYAADIPTFRDITGVEKPLADITQADVDAILAGYTSNKEVKAFISGAKPFTEAVTIPVKTAPAEQINSAAIITPRVNKNLKDPMTGKMVNPLTQAVAYADAVTRVCDLNMPMQTRMQLEGGIAKYQILKQGKSASELGGAMIGYMLALQDSGLIVGAGGGDKSKAKKLCTSQVKSELLGEMEKVATGDLDKVGFLKPYL